MKKINKLIIIFLFFGILTNCIANPQAISDATEDANRYNAMLWGTAGVIGGFACCIGGIIPIAMSQHSGIPTITDRLIGKSAEYTAQYTNTYTKLVKQKRWKYASIGCLVGSSACVFGSYLLSESFSDSTFNGSGSTSSNDSSNGFYSTFW